MLFVRISDFLRNFENLAVKISRSESQGFYKRRVYGRWHFFSRYDIMVDNQSKSDL